ncbi:hypothetical protein, partial [Pseudidiomarina halophila]
NSVVKRFSADGSVGFPHVRVGHRQALIKKRPRANARGFFMSAKQTAKALFVARTFGVASLLVRYAARL